MLHVYDRILVNFETSGIPLDHIRLLIVDSPRGDLETVLTNVNSHIIFDQALYDILRVLVSALFAEVNVHLGWPAIGHDRTSPWLHAVFANRYLSEGLSEEALIHATECWAGREAERAPAWDINRVNAWMSVQAAFALAHELGHCPLSRGSDHSVARSTAWDFEKEMRPLAQQYDAMRSDGGDKDFIESHDERIKQEQIVWAAQARDRLEKLIKIRNDAAEQITKLDPAFTLLPPLAYKRMSHEEQLDWVLRDDSRIGEEVLCDYLALVLTANLMGEIVLPFEECLTACVMTMYELSLLRCAELVCRAATGSAMRTGAWRQLFQELDARQGFIGISAQLLHEKWLLGELDPSHDAQRRTAILEERRAAFARHLNRFAHVFVTRLLTILVDQDPRAMQAAKDEVVADEYFQSWLRSPSLARIVADMTSIGPPPAEEPTPGRNAGPP